jgi:transcription-repair coupling factor (superfamily II helicase)
VLNLDRPIIAITSLASEAEALAGELAFFLDQPATCDAASARVHFLPAWEVRPFAHLSPPPDAQAAQLAALFAMLRTAAPVVVTSAEALMMRTLPRRVFEDSVIRLALAEGVDLDAIVEALTAMGYQRVPQTEEPGDFSVRGGIVDIFSPLYNNPVRIELEEDIVTSIRHFDSSSQRSLGEVDEVTVIRTRLVPPSILRDKHLVDRVALRCAEIGMVRKETAELTETLENGLLFPGVELISPLLYEHGLESIFEYVPANAVAWMIDPGRILGEAERIAERVANEAAAAQAKPIFYPAPESLYLRTDELERSLSAIIAVEVGSLITVTAPREGWASPIELQSQPSLRLGAAELAGTNAAPSFEPLATELAEVRRGQGRALMVVEGPNQAARLRRHLEAYDVEINTECKGYAALL